ncbi:hypothetical protein HDU97_002397 [Phlyctochytrium planicorne]|nr:hypothetical protein HDU97_002397 [Phlyctochytrium planicorne]
MARRGQPMLTLTALWWCLAALSLTLATRGKASNAAILGGSGHQPSHQREPLPLDECPSNNDAKTRPRGLRYKIRVLREYKAPGMTNVSFGIEDTRTGMSIRPREIVNSRGGISVWRIEASGRLVRQPEALGELRSDAHMGFPIGNVDTTFVNEVNLTVGHNDLLFRFTVIRKRHMADAVALESDSEDDGRKRDVVNDGAISSLERGGFLHWMGHNWFTVPRRLRSTSATGRSQQQQQESSQTRHHHSDTHSHPHSHTHRSHSHRLVGHPRPLPTRVHSSSTPFGRAVAATSAAAAVETSTAVEVLPVRSCTQRSRSHHHRSHSRSTAGSETRTGVPTPTIRIVAVTAHAVIVVPVPRSVFPNTPKITNPLPKPAPHQLNLF